MSPLINRPTCCAIPRSLCDGKSLLFVKRVGNIIVSAAAATTPARLIHRSRSLFQVHSLTWSGANVHLVSHKTTNHLCNSLANYANIDYKYAMKMTDSLIGRLIVTLRPLCTVLYSVSNYANGSMTNEIFRSMLLALFVHELRL